MDGIINVYKEQGYTSHDVVAKLRGILHMKKIGHTGTLDPDAEGVLPVCLGKGTKLCGMITDWTKTYEAVMLLGTVTDTQDASGKVLSRSEADLSAADIIDAVNSFEGDYSQVPPMYSALKYNGHKLYELARSGIEVDRKPRLVRINTIHVNDVSLDGDKKTVTFTTECSKGTYIRTLCDDIGKKLGCGACMLKLTRTRVGSFNMDESLTLEEIQEIVSKGQIMQHILPIDEMFPDYQKIEVLKDYDRLIYNGNKFTKKAVKEQAAECNDTDKVRVYDHKNQFIGVYQYLNGVFSPVKMFYSQQKGGSDV